MIIKIAIGKDFEVQLMSFSKFRRMEEWLGLIKPIKAVHELTAEILFQGDTVKVVRKMQRAFGFLTAHVLKINEADQRMFRRGQPLTR